MTLKVKVRLGQVIWVCFDFKLLKKRQVDEKARRRCYKTSSSEK